MTTNPTEEVAHDYESLMNEADQLMEDLQLDEAPPIVIDGFSIDEEFALDGLGDDDGAAANTNTNDDDPPAPQSSVIHPLQDDFMTRDINTSTTTGNGSSMFPAGVAATNSNSPSMMNATSPSLDQIKAQTSKFASAFASFAQKAASQVAAAAAATTNAGPTPYGMSPTTGLSSGGGGHMSNSMSNMMNYSNYGGSLGSPSFSIPGVGNIMSTPTMPPTQQQPSTSTAAELDNETKSRLIKEHVGDLLPGERVIMFLSNLLHVSDSTGFSFVASNNNTMTTMNGTTTTSNPEMWCCVMTYYRLVLFGTHRTQQQQQQQQQVLLPTLPRPDWNPTCWPSSTVTHPHLLEIPLASMERVEKSVYTAGKPAHTTSLIGLVIFGKDNGRVLRFTTPSYADTLRAHEALHTYAFPGRRNLGYLFAFESKRVDVMASIVVEENGQKKITVPPSMRRFEALIEFQRQLGITSLDAPEYSTKPWTIYTKLNANYQLCFSYPSILMGPATLPESSPDAVRMLTQCAGFRSEQRMLALTWANPIDGASLWRSSQPKIGIQGNRSMADEMVLKHIMDAAARSNASRPPFPPIDATQLQLLTGSMDLKEWTASADTNNLKCSLKILDLRPRSAAMANRTSGYGYENTSNYPGATLQFCNIGNIHAVRDSYQKLATLCNNPSASDVQWNALVEDTKWLAQVRTILAAAWEAAFWVHVHRLPVLLHCSHGWDRTSQVSVLTQMMLDPYYRTVRGFTTLVEKDFMSFGHPFHTRCAHGEGRGDRGNVTSTTTSSSSNAANNSSNNAADEGQISPIFIQFLDCAYQIVSQYPECFEFNTNYLLMVSEHVYSCRFGNMLCDTERERELLAGIRQRTFSLWDFLEEPDQRAQVMNPNFTAPDGVLLMPLPTLLRNVSLWSERHCKYGAKPTLRRSPPSPAVVAWTTTNTTTPTATGANDVEAEELSTISTPSKAPNNSSTEALS